MLLKLPKVLLMNLTEKENLTGLTLLTDKACGDFCRFYSFL